MRGKGNGVFWDSAHAQATLQVRALVISKRWDQHLAALRALELRYGCQAWQRTPRPMSIKADPPSNTPRTNRIYRVN